MFASNVALAQTSNDGSSQPKFQLPLFGQQKKFSTDLLEQPNPYYKLPQGVIKEDYPGMNSLKSPVLVSSKMSNGSSTILQPDNMPCFLPDMRKVEKMPCAKFEDMQAKDPMPNGMKKVTILSSEK